MPNHDEQLNNYLKENIIKLVKDHREHCNGTECDICLYAVKILLQKAGIELNDEEFRNFI